MLLLLKYLQELPMFIEVTHSKVRTYMIKRWGDIFSGTGTVVTSLLSCAACPMCLPIYAGLLSLIGIELIEIHAYFFPIMMVFSVLTLGFMAYQTSTHHASWLPFKFASVAALGMAICAYFGFEYILYACLVFFMGSIFWGKWTLAHKGHGCC